MSQFSYSDYTNMVASAQANADATKIGYFKLASDGDEALVRINCGNVDSLAFASVHTTNLNNRWAKISCLNPLGSYSSTCPLCKASETDKSISKASKKVYLQMLVSYRDKTTGTFSAPIPVIWERPAGFSREIANKLRDYGDLRQILLKVTRNGAAGDMKTTYSIDYAVPTVFKPELIPMDFSAFNNFNLARHSYYEKTAAEISEFIATGSFPEFSEAGKVDSIASDVGVKREEVNTAPLYNGSSFIEQQTTIPQTTTPPARNFNTGKFSF